MKRKSFVKETFTGVEVPAGFVARDLSFVDCVFQAGRTPVVELFEPPASGTAFVTLERVTFTRPKSDVQRISLVVLRDVEIEDWHTGREPVFVQNCLFDRVRLRGFIGDLLLEARLDALMNTELDLALDFYDGVEWALDLREANFGSVRLSGVPGDKVLFDPRRHCRVLIERLKADDGWRKFRPFLVSEIESWLREPCSSIVTVAGERSKYFQEWRQDHALLRKHGYAE